MTKTQKIIYWIATVWLSLGMVATGLVQFCHQKEQTALFAHLGYPLYFLNLLAIWKFLGAIAILMPKFPLLKEWVYAGFFFAMSGAVYSHFALHDEAKEFSGPSLLIVLTFTSWYFRPASRKVNLN